MHKFCKIDKCPQITALYSGFTTLRKAGYNYRGEGHDFWEMVFVMDGKLQETAGERVFLLEKGEVIVHNPMQFHALNCSLGVDATILIFSFEGENIPFLQDKVYKVEDLSEVWDLYHHARKAFIFDDIYFKDFKGDKNEGYKFVKELELFIMRLADNLTNPKMLTTQGANNYNAAIKVLNQNIERRLSVTEIAALCNMSTISLQKTFSRFANIGVMEYFNRLKINKAKQYLKEGFSVKETALKLGFYDPNYFSTVFKRITGNSPESFKAYREDE